MTKLHLPGSFVDWLNTTDFGRGATHGDQALYSTFKNGRDMRAGQNYTKRIKFPEGDSEESLRRLWDLADDAADYYRVNNGPRALYLAARVVKQRVETMLGES